MKTLLISAFLAIIAAASSLHGQTYQVTDLGLLSGAPTFATAINDNGIVCGYAQPTPTTAKAWIFANNQMTELPGLGGSEARALAVGADGRIYGFATDAAGLAHAMRWENGVGTDLGPASGTEGWYPQAVNASGLIAGHIGTATAPTSAFSLSSGTFAALPTLAGATPPATSAAYDLNDSGQIVGVSSWVGGGTRAFRTGASGGPVSLGTLGANDSTAMSINAAGDVVGYSVNGSNQTHAFIFTDGGGLRDLGVLTGHLESRAYAMNDPGLVVGASEDPAGSGRAFLWNGSGALLDLNPLIPPNSGFVLNEAQDINGGGDIVGNGTLGGVTHAFILERFEGLDTLAPIVSGSVAVTTGYPSSAVTVNFWDNEKVVGATTHAFGMIRITGPNGFDTTATIQSWFAADRQASTSTFIFTPPGGSWNGADNGTYEIRLAANVVSDLAGNLHPGGVIGSFSVGIQTAPVLNSITLPTTATLGTPVNLSFNATGSYPAAAGDLFTVAVDWDGDSAVVETLPGLASNAIIPHTFTSLGTHTVRVRVTDPHGLQSSERTASVTVSNNGAAFQNAVVHGTGLAGISIGLTAATVKGGTMYFFGTPSEIGTQVTTWDYLTPGAGFVSRGDFDNGPIIPAGAGVDSRGRIVIYGGYEAGAAATASCETYTIAGGVGAGVASMPGATYPGPTTSDNLSRLYILANSATLYRYTAGASGNGAWATLAGIPTAGSTVACMSFDGGDRIIAFVGTAVWTYSISGNVWTQLGTAPIAPARAILGADGLVYLIKAREIWAFDPVVNTIAKMGTTNYDESTAIVLKGTDGFIYLIGGNGTNIETFDTRATTTQVPVITSTPTGTTLPQSTPWSYTIAAGGKPRPTYSLVRGPAGLTVGTTAGTVAWTPTPAQTGPQTALVRASNSAGSADQLITFNVLDVPPDTTPPSAPTNLAVFNITANSADISWTGSTDNLGVTGYRVMEKRTSGSRWHRTTYYYTLGTTTGTSWHFANLPACSTRTYYVGAIDAAGNLSTKATVTFMLQCPPAIYADGSGTFGGLRAIVSEPWTSNVFTATGNPLPTLSVTSAPAGAVWHAGSASSGYFTWTAAAGQEGAQSFVLGATSVAGSASFTRTVEVYPAGTDLIPPTAVPSLVVDQVSFDSCRATWTPATDNYGVNGYRVVAAHREPRRRFHHGAYNDHVVSFNVAANTTQLVIPGLRASTSYIVSVTATDAAGLWGYAVTREIRTLLQPFVVTGSQVTTTANLDGSTTLSWPGYGYYWKFTVESSPDLTTWQPVEPAGQWPSYLTTFTFTPTAGVPQLFYRVRAVPAALP